MVTRSTLVMLLAVLICPAILAAVTATFYSGPTPGAVTSLMIQDEAITADKVQDGAVLSAKFAPGSVISSKVSSGVVTNAKIADGTVPIEKIAPGTGMFPASTQTYLIPAGTLASDIQAWIELLPKNIPNDVTVTLHFSDGVYSMANSLSFTGFYGGGQVVIEGNTSETNAQALHTTQTVVLDFSSANSHAFYFSNNAVNFTIQNLNLLVGSDQNNNSAVYSTTNSETITVQYNFLRGTSVASGSLMFGEFSTVYVKRNYFSTASRAIHAFRTAKIDSDSNSTTAPLPVTGLRSDSAIIMKSGVQPVAATTPEEQIYGGRIF